MYPNPPQLRRVAGYITHDRLFYESLFQVSWQIKRLLFLLFDLLTRAEKKPEQETGARCGEGSDRDWFVLEAPQSISHGHKGTN